MPSVPKTAIIGYASIIAPLGIRADPVWAGNRRFREIFVNAATSHFD